MQSEKASMSAPVHAVVTRRLMLGRRVIFAVIGERSAVHFWVEPNWEDNEKSLADLIIHDVAKRKAMRLATPKQVRVLERFGFPHVGAMTFINANKLITRIASNGWRLPHDLKSQIKVVNA